MNRRLPVKAAGYDTQYFSLLLCGSLFICGCIAGVFSSGFVTSADELGRIFAGLFSTGAEASKASLGVFFDSSKYHIFALFLSFSVLGVIGIPAVSAVRGFFFCFSVSLMVRYYGGDGVRLALAGFGFTAVFSIPSFIVLSCFCFDASLRLLRCVLRQGGAYLQPYGAAFFSRVGICFVVTIVSFFIEEYIMSMVVNRIIAGL